MSTTENNVNPNSSSTGWFGWIWGAKPTQTALVPGPIPPATMILRAQEPPPASPLAPAATGGDSSPDCVDDADAIDRELLLRNAAILGASRRDAEPQDLPAVLGTPETQSPVSPGGHSAWRNVGAVLGLDSCVSPQKPGDEQEQFARRCGLGSVKFRVKRTSSVGGSAQAAAAASVPLEHPSSEPIAATPEIKKEQLSEHDKKIIRYRSYILVTSAVISTLGLGIYLLWPKRSQDGSFDFTSITNAPHLCTDFLRTFVGNKICPLSTELGFGDCSTDLTPPPKAR